MRCSTGSTPTSGVLESALRNGMIVAVIVRVSLAEPKMRGAIFPETGTQTDSPGARVTSGVGTTTRM